MFKFNPVTCIDFYKADHRRQYPDNTQLVYSNFTPRSDRLAKVLPTYWDQKVVFFGLQAFIKAFLMDAWNNEFFGKDKRDVVAKYKRRMDTSLGADAVPVDHIAALHDLGYLPIEIKALDEGSKVNIRIPVFTIKNTKPEFFWLVNYLETVLSAGLWKATTSATIAYQYRKLLQDFAIRTGTEDWFVDWQAHDFSFRGMSGLDDALMSGAGHLTSFTGTDTVPAIDFMEDYYNANAEIECIGGSVPATEHSVMCMGGNLGEKETFERLLNLYPSGVVSVVSDTWDFWNVLTSILPSLKDKIMSREGKLVIRPDSGDPVKILCGYDYVEGDIDFDFDLLSAEDGVIKDLETGKYYLVKARDTGWNTEFDLTEMSETEVKGAVEALYEIFGGTVTSTGHKLLDSHIGLIYGDSITLERAEAILKRLEAKGFASGNVVFGVGSFTYEYVTRDTFGFAMKATYGVVDGVGRELFKDPVTDSGTKKSAKGLLSVVQDMQTGDYILLDQCTEEQEKESLMDVVFKDGVLVKQTSLSEIRNRIKTDETLHDD